MLPDPAEAWLGGRFQARKAIRPAINAEVSVSARRRHKAAQSSAKHRKAAAQRRHDGMRERNLERHADCRKSVMNGDEYSGKQYGLREPSCGRMWRCAGWEDRQRRSQGESDSLATHW